MVYDNFHAQCYLLSIQMEDKTAKLLFSICKDRRYKHPRIPIMHWSVQVFVCRCDCLHLAAVCSVLWLMLWPIYTTSLSCCYKLVLFFYYIAVVSPTMVSYLDVVVGLCSDDPKDFYNLEDRSVLRADQTRESIYYTLLVLLCWFRLHSRLRLYSHLLTASQPLFMASQPSTCKLVVTFGDVHWAELIRPQRWAGVTACPPQRQGKLLWAAVPASLYGWLFQHSRLQYSCSYISTVQFWLLEDLGVDEECHWNI